MNLCESTNLVKQLVNELRKNNSDAYVIGYICQFLAIAIAFDMTQEMQNKNISLIEYIIKTLQSDSQSDTVNQSETTEDWQNVSAV